MMFVVFFFFFFDAWIHSLNMASFEALKGEVIGYGFYLKSSLLISSTTVQYIRHYTPGSTPWSFIIPGWFSLPFNGRRVYCGDIGIHFTMAMALVCQQNNCSNKSLTNKGHTHTNRRFHCLSSLISINRIHRDTHRYLATLCCVVSFIPSLCIEKSPKSLSLSLSVSKKK